MYTKTVLAAAALAASVAAYDLPACWSTCFSDNGVVSQGCLCKDGLREAVSGCIAAGCSADEAGTYEGWASDYCDAPIPSSVPVPASSSAVVYPVSSSSYVEAVSSSAVYYPSSSAVAPHSYPAPPPSSAGWGSSAAPVTSAPAPSGYPAPSGSAVYPISSGAPSGYPVPSGSEAYPVPSGAASGYPSGSYGGGYGTAVASTGYAVASSYAGPYATGAAAPMATAGAGMAFIVGGIAAALL